MRSVHPAVASMSWLRGAEGVVVADPAGELLGLVRTLGDPAPDEASPAARARAELVRRRFGLALPPPFAPVASASEPVRRATAHDGAAIAAIKWRCFGTAYRGLLPDDFLDNREVVPPASYWTGRAMVPPSRRHGLFVWGRPGVVHGYVDVGPVEPEDRTIGEVFELYVDPSRHRLGGGARLLDAGLDHLVAAGFDRVELSVLDSNESARAFYRSRGWTDTGRVTTVDLGVVAFDERRLQRSLPG